jgi:regulator of sigma E protease
MTVIIFLIVLAVLIFVHELGHFLAARACGIRVDAFAIGFGPKLVSWTRGETKYSLNLIPFGGYVKIFGENPDAESMTGPDAKRSFVNKAKWQQVMVLAAGVFFNFVFAWMLYIVMFVSGTTVATDTFPQYADRFTDERVVISYVTPDSPAQKAGIEPGTTVLSIDGRTMTAEETTEFIHAHDATPFVAEVEYKGEKRSVSITPEEGLIEGSRAIGVYLENAASLQLPIYKAVIEGTNYFNAMFKGTAVGLWGFFGSIFKGTANFADVSGPVGIAGVVGDAAQMGMTFLMMITALISINLGIINLVPFPALDGGRILFVIIETAIRRRIPIKFANVVNTVGFAALMLLMIVVTYKDIAKLIK